MSTWCSPITGKSGIAYALSTQIDYQLGRATNAVRTLATRVLGAQKSQIFFSSNPSRPIDISTLPDKQQWLISILKKDFEGLWQAAKAINPNFKSMPANICLVEGQPAGTSTPGGGLIYLTRDDIKAPLEIEDHKDALDHLYGIVAHEMSHSIARHQLRIKLMTLLALLVVNTVNWSARRFYFNHIIPCLKKLLPKVPTTFFNFISLFIASQLVGRIIITKLVPLYFQTSRQHENEADSLSALIITKYNQTCPEGGKINTDAVANMWKAREHLIRRKFEKMVGDNFRISSCVELQPSPTDTHPTDMQRYRAMQRAFLILENHPDVLTDLTKRQKYFEELKIDRDPSDPKFKRNWGLI